MGPAQEKDPSAQNCRSLINLAFKSIYFLKQSSIKCKVRKRIYHRLPCETGFVQTLGWSFLSESRQASIPTRNDQPRVWTKPVSRGNLC